jgi:hypothetical protein
MKDLCYACGQDTELLETDLGRKSKWYPATVLCCPPCKERIEMASERIPYALCRGIVAGTIRPSVLPGDGTHGTIVLAQGPEHDLRVYDNGCYWAARLIRNTERSMDRFELSRQEAATMNLLGRLWDEGQSDHPLVRAYDVLTKLGKQSQGPLS